MKKVIFKYNRVSDIMGFLAIVKPSNYHLDAGEMCISCDACAEIKRVAADHGLELISEE